MSENGLRGVMKEWLVEKRAADQLADSDAEDMMVKGAYRRADEKLSAVIERLDEDDSGLALSGRHDWDDDFENELLSEVRVGRFLEAALSKKAPDGAEAELVQELKLQPMAADGITLPLIALAPRRTQRDREDLADVSTVLNPGDYKTNMSNAIMPVFAQSDLAFLGTIIQAVRPGQERIPVIESVPTPTAAAKGARVDAAAASIKSVKFDPKALTSSVDYSLREHYNFGPELEDTLREAMRMALVAQVDAMGINGTGSDDQPVGMFASFKGNKLPTNPSGEATFASYSASVSGEVDGIYAANEQDMRLLLGTSTYRHARSKLATNTSVDAIEKLERMGVSVQASSRPAAIASKRQDALLALSGMAARSGFWAGVWEALFVVVDMATGAKRRNVSITATAFMDCGPTRVGASDATNAEILGIRRLRYQVQP